MRNLILAFVCIFGAAMTSHADGVSWGKYELFSIKTIHYKGQVYSGALIASDVQPSNVSGVGTYTTIINPRILVYNVNFGLDKIFELDYRPDTAGKSEISPLCLNLGKKHTQMYDADLTDGPVARFISADVVEISSSVNSYSTKATISCSDFYVAR